MGFDVAENTALLDFTGTRYAGAEVKVRCDIPFDEYREFEKLELLAEEWAWFREHALVSWNLETKGKPIPLKAEMDALPRGVVRSVIRAWVGTVLGIAAPLAETSS